MDDAAKWLNRHKSDRRNKDPKVERKRRRRSRAQSERIAIRNAAVLRGSPELLSASRQVSGADRRRGFKGRDQRERIDFSRRRENLSWAGE
jgi:hypothetical protein